MSLPWECRIRLCTPRTLLFSGIAALPKNNTLKRMGVYVDVFICEHCRRERHVLWEMERIRQHKLQEEQYAVAVDNE